MASIGEYKLYIHLNPIKHDEEGYEIVGESGATSDVEEMEEAMTKVLEVLEKAKKKGLIAGHEIYFEDYHDG